MAIRTVVFDMDGTLVQSRGAAWEVFQDTVAEFDLAIGTPEEFFDLFRDNFFVALREFVGDPVRARAVAEHFLTALRERYTPELIPGMTDVIHALAGHYSLAVISSNAMTAIRRTLDASGVAHCFAHVFSGDVESDKAASIHRILADPSYATIRRCTPSYLEEGHTAHADPAGEEIVLITDTVGDVREGVSCGIRVFGVAWGMHTADDLRAAGAEFVALWPQEIVARLLPDGSCAAAGQACACLSCDLPGAAATADAALPGPRDVRAEAAVAGRLRRTRRSAPPTPTVACCTACDEPSVKVADRPAAPDPYLAVALSIIAPDRTPSATP